MQIMKSRRRRSLVLKVKQSARLRVAKGRIGSLKGLDVTPLADLLRSDHASIRPLVGVSEDLLQNKAAYLRSSTGIEVPDLSVYYRVEASEGCLEKIAKQLRRLEIVEVIIIH